MVEADGLVGTFLAVGMERPTGHSGHGLGLVVISLATKRPPTNEQAIRKRTNVVCLMGPNDDTAARRIRDANA